MISEKMRPLVENNSVIRVMFEEGKRLAAIYGKENVYDFSLGNPNVPAPDEVREAILEILNEEESTFVHGYMSNAGYEDVRQTIACSLNERFETEFGADNILMTVGAASGLNVILKTILNPGEEVIVIAPYFVEYGNYVANYDGKLVVVPPNTKDFQPDLKGLESRITKKTKAVIINTPNNPTGVVYSHDTLRCMADILKKKEQEFGSVIVLISDEPYRELAYDGVKVPYVTKYYRDTVVCYSYSKSLSLPGERIGYLVIPDELKDSREVFTAVSIANRVLGSVNAPSLMQRVIKRCIEKGARVNLAAYDRNRNRLYEGLKECGFSCIRPEGAFYLFVKSPVADEKKFCSRASAHNLLLVPGSSFACPGYVRIAYCVSYEQIERSMPAFRALAKEYGLVKA
ncbi:MAG: pyridoxal phosphate-dependent aminotransferase [Lachnospiraceae bacterium]|jgi:aspartate aminotransferase|nr:pyridoxal phosphate-dependent aminotransferase [Lachnospiraceae bacterium]MCI9106517.1 pyridoxal phosphate-dependent aminotransferase [Lachnospiraceae bacterium]